MIYLIGGAPRVGKTTLAKIILERKNIPFIPADVLTQAIDHTYPKLGVRSGEWEDIPDKFYPYLREFVSQMKWNLPDYVIEGDSFFPRHVKKLAKEFKVKSVFLGTSHASLEEIKKFAFHGDWTNDLSEKKQKELPDWLVSLSKMFKTEADKYKIPYFDMSEDREQKLEEAYSALFD